MGCDPSVCGCVTPSRLRHVQCISMLHCIVAHSLVLHRSCMNSQTQQSAHAHTLVLWTCCCLSTRSPPPSPSPSSASASAAVMSSASSSAGPRDPTLNEPASPHTPQPSHNATTTREKFDVASVAIPMGVERDGVVFYNVNVKTTDGDKWSSLKRFSAFERLHQVLSELFGHRGAIRGTHTVLRDRAGGHCVCSALFSAPCRCLALSERHSRAPISVHPSLYRLSPRCRPSAEEVQVLRVARERPLHRGEEMSARLVPPENEQGQAGQTARTQGQPRRRRVDVHAWICWRGRLLTRVWRALSAPFPGASRFPRL